MKLRFAAILILSVMAAQASAAQRKNISTMTCAEVQALIEEEGEAILSYGSTGILGLPVYDRYVSGRQYCAENEVLRRAGVPTVDQKYCPVSRCVESDIFIAK